MIPLCLPLWLQLPSVTGAGSCWQGPEASVTVGRDAHLEFNWKHFLIIWVRGRIQFQKRYWNVQGSFNIYFSSCFLGFFQQMLEGKMFKLNKNAWKEKGENLPFPENVPKPFKIRKLLFSNVINVLASFSHNFGKSAGLQFHSFSSIIISSEEMGGEGWNMAEEQMAK